MVGVVKGMANREDEKKTSGQTLQWRQGRERGKNIQGKNTCICE